MTWLATTAGIGAAIVGGVFFVFSVAIMPAFARLAPEHGTAVMQAITAAARTSSSVRIRHIGPST